MLINDQAAREPTTEPQQALEMTEPQQALEMTEPQQALEAPDAQDQGLRETLSPRSDRLNAMTDEEVLAMALNDPEYAGEYQAVEGGVAPETSQLEAGLVG